MSINMPVMAYSQPLSKLFFSDEELVTGIARG